MQTITLTAHFDGQRIVLDEPYQLEADTPLMITILPKPTTEQEEWQHFSSQQLARAYSNEEPDYSTAPLINYNKEYAGS